MKFLLLFLSLVFFVPLTLWWGIYPHSALKTMISPNLSTILPSETTLILTFLTRFIAVYYFIVGSTMLLSVLSSSQKSQTIVLLPIPFACTFAIHLYVRISDSLRDDYGVVPPVPVEFWIWVDVVCVFIITGILGVEYWIERGLWKDTKLK